MEVTVVNSLLLDFSEWIVACSEEEARGMRRGEEGGRMRQDTDVLDTWFR